VATFDQLSDQQRAIIELILRRGQTYDELSDRLGLSESRVRELARDALVRLAPVTAQRVEEDWRGQLADYVLGQQAGPESTATRGHLRRSEAARSWTRSLLDSLDTLYSNGLPAIPDGDRSRRGRERREEPAGTAAVAEPRPSSRPLSPEARAAVRRRRILAAGGLLALALVAVLLWPIGVLTGGGDDEGSGSPAASGAQRSVNTRVQGQALILEQGSKQVLFVTAAGLTPSDQSQAYEVWLYNSAKDAKSLGFAAANRQGALQGRATLPADYRKYKFIDVSHEPVDESKPEHSGESVVRGLIELLDKPIVQGSGKNRTKALANIRLVPLPQGGG
jgi:anti-sigma-K factor RskA